MIGTVLVVSGAVLIGGGFVLIVNAFKFSSRKAQETTVLEPVLASEAVLITQSSDRMAAGQALLTSPADAKIHIPRATVPSQLRHKAKGDSFEAYVLRKMPDPPFTLMEWRGDKSSQGRYPESNRYPDLKMQFEGKTGVWEFAVECKYRSYSSADAVEWCRPDQLATYQKYEREAKIPVFVVIGMGGAPECPEHVSIFRLEEVGGNTFSAQQCLSHKRPNNELDFAYEPRRGGLS